MVQDAVIRKLEVIGEATKQLPDEVKQMRPEVPWRNCWHARQDDS